MGRIAFPDATATPGLALGGEAKVREATVLTDANGGVANAPRGSDVLLAAIQPLHVATYVEALIRKGRCFGPSRGAGEG